MKQKFSLLRKGQFVPFLSSKKTKKEKISPEISISEEAAKQLKKLMKEEHKKGWVLKFEDTPNHFGESFSYHLKLQKKADPKDKLFQSRGVRISIPKESFKRLKASVIEYRGKAENELFEDLLQIGFTIENPNICSFERRCS